MNIERFEGTGRMSRCVKCNGMIYLCGQTDTTAADIQGQTKNVLAKVEDLLNKYGSDKQHMLAATIYVKTMDDFAAMNEVYGTFFEGAFPARSAFQVAAVPRGAKLEIEAIAYAE